MAPVWKSSDGGATWRKGFQIPQPAPGLGATWTSTRVTDGSHHSAYPEIAVADNETLGVLYIDYDDSGPNTIFRHHFARSFDGGATWTDEILQSMNPTPLPNAANGFLWGDYEGLTALGNTFYGVFTGESTGRSTAQLDPIFFTETAEADSAPKAPKLAPKSNCPMPARRGV